MVVVAAARQPRQHRGMADEVAEVGMVRAFMGRLVAGHWVRQVVATRVTAMWARVLVVVVVAEVMRPMSGVVVAAAPPHHLSDMVLVVEVVVEVDEPEMLLLRPGTAGSPATPA